MQKRKRTVMKLLKETNLDDADEDGKHQSRERNTREDYGRYNKQISRAWKFFKDNISTYMSIT